MQPPTFNVFLEQINWTVNINRAKISKYKKSTEPKTYVNINRWKKL